MKRKNKTLLEETQIRRMMGLAGIPAIKEGEFIDSYRKQYVEAEEEELPAEDPMAAADPAAEELPAEEPVEGEEGLRQFNIQFYQFLAFLVFFNKNVPKSAKIVPKN